MLTNDGRLPIIHHALLQNAFLCLGQTEVIHELHDIWSQINTCRLWKCVFQVLKGEKNIYF